MWDGARTGRPGGDELFGQHPDSAFCRSGRATELRDRLTNRILKAEAPYDGLIRVLQGGAQLARQDRAGAYLPCASHPTFDRLAEDWIAVLDLQIPTYDALPHIVTMTGLHLLLYQLQRAAEVLDLVGHSDPFVRCGAADLLGRIPQAAGRSKEVLTPLLADEAFAAVGVTGRHECEGRLYHWHRARRSPRAAASRPSPAHGLANDHLDSSRSSSASRVLSPSGRTPSRPRSYSITGGLNSPALAAHPELSQPAPGTISPRQVRPPALLPASVATGARPRRLSLYSASRSGVVSPADSALTSPAQVERAVSE